MSVDKSSAKVRAMFGDIAGTYDLLNHLMSANQDKRWRRRAVSLLGPRAGHRILDLCCGTGDLGQEILRQQPHCEVIGGDFAVPMLQIATKKMPATPFSAADALRLPFPDSTFHGITVGFGARNWSDTAAGLREAHRVLLPGGKLMILEFMQPQSTALRSFYGFFNNFLAPLGRRISGHHSAYDYLPQSIGGFYTRTTFAELMRQNGFSNVRSFNYFGGVATAFIGTRQ